MDFAVKPRNVGRERSLEQLSTAPNLTTIFLGHIKVSYYEKNHDLKRQVGCGDRHNLLINNHLKMNALELN
jgi:hypothetical protein